MEEEQKKIKEAIKDFVEKNNQSLQYKEDPWDNPVVINGNETLNYEINDSIRVSYKSKVGYVKSVDYYSYKENEQAYVSTFTNTLFKPDDIERHYKRMKELKEEN